MPKQDVINEVIEYLEEKARFTVDCNRLTEINLAMDLLRDGDVTPAIRILVESAVDEIITPLKTLLSPPGKPDVSTRVAAERIEAVEKRLKQIRAWINVLGDRRKGKEMNKV